MLIDGLRPTLLLLSTLLIPELAFAQLPPRVEFSENANGTIHIEASSTLFDGARIYTQFGASKGAYLNGVKAYTPTVPQTCQVSPTNPVSSCFYWTGDCVSCGQDPQGSAGEVSCFCKKEDPAWSVNDLFSIVPSGMATDFDIGLTTDMDHDGTIDQDLFSRQAANPTGDQMRLYQLNAELARVDWEDIAQGPDGDFNDHTFYLSGRDCITEDDGFPLMTLEAMGDNGVYRDCRSDECNAPLDPDCNYSSYLGDREIEFTVSVAVDRENSENDRESVGRLLFVTLATYAEASFQGLDIVICPSLVIDRPLATDPTTGVGYGMRPGYDSNNCDEEPDTGDPICSDRQTAAGPAADVDYFALSRDQLYSVNACDPRFGTGDIFFIQPPVDATSGTIQCTLNMPHIETYQVSIEALGAAMREPLDTMTAQEILDLIDGVELRFFPSPRVGKFYCPSGYNMRLSTVDHQIGYLQEAFVPDQIGAFNYTEIIRD